MFQHFTPARVIGLGGLVAWISVMLVSRWTEGQVAEILKVLGSLIGFSVFVYLLVTAETKKRQNKRNVLTIQEKIRSGDSPVFGLYLRPFYVTGKIWTRVDPPPGSYSTPIRYYQFEDQIVDAFFGRMTFIALGLSHERGAVGRMLADEREWWDTALNLIDHAKLVICIPSFRPGTKRELDYIIKNGKLKKTVFIMPPDQRFITSFKEQRDDWEAVSDYLKLQGVQIPRYTRKGRLFRIDPGGWCVEADLDLTSNTDLRTAIVQLTGIDLPRQPWR